jgi:3-methyl-2-oxobutanoate hydroxymethyltransferase
MINKQATTLVNDLRQKKGGEKIVCLTAYTYPVAKILDEFCDIILVGDSLGMAIYGMPDTIDVTLEMMINHGKSVKKATKKSLVIVDIPCGSYEKSPEQALKTVKKIVDETACDGVKMETRIEDIRSVEIIANAGIPIMTHIGLLPQQVRVLGGYKYQGRDEKSAQEILQIAKLSEKVGAFAVVIEAVPEHLADKITASLKIPTIGIGASLACDGQILVIDDLLGLNQEFKPKFVKQYASLSQIIRGATEEFAKDVRSKKFPSKENILIK